MRVRQSRAGTGKFSAWETHILICLSLLALAHNQFHLLQPTHFLVNLLQHSSTLLQPKYDIFLNQSELDV